MHNYLTLLAASILLALDFTIQKVYQQKSGTGIVAGLAFNTVVGFCTSVLFFVINGFSVDFTLYGFLVAGTMSVCVFVYTIIGFRILRDGNMALYTLFLMTGGMVVPYIFGIAFLGEAESVTVLKITGVVLIVSAVIMSNLKSCKTNKTQLFLCTAVLLLNGACSVLSKIGQMDVGYGKIDVYDFVCMTGIVKFVICGIALIVYFFLKMQKNNGSKLSAKILPIIIISAAVGSISYMLQLIGAAKLPASVLFPMVSGGSIVFSTLAGVIFFKERPTKWQIAGVVTCVIGTLFLM